MSTITSQDKNGNTLEFNPYEKKYRYKVNGEVKTGCTSIIDPRFGKAGLMGWAKKLPIEALKWQMRDDGKPIDEIEAYISKLKTKVDELSIKDANIGTMMHTLCEDYITGKKPVAPTTEPLKTMFPKFTQWWDNMKIEVIETEKTYYSEELDACGTVDLICKMNGKIGLIDFKTSKSIDYSNYVIQLSAYRKMIMDSTDYKIEFLGLVNIPKDAGLPINFRKIKVKNDYLQAFKLCKQLLDFENDYSKQLSDWKKLINKQKREKQKQKQ